MNVQEFFNQKNEDIVDFDFSNDVLQNIKTRNKDFNEQKEKYLSNNINPLVKYQMYKTYFSIDPDSNDGLLKDIYKEIWDNNMLKYCSSDNNERYYSDTLTSVQGLLSKYYLCTCEDEWKDYKRSKNNRVRYFSVNVFKDMLLNIDKYPNFKQIFSEKDVINFIKYYHTLGNYMPVPKGFNTARSGMIASHDMWDISLEKIKKYYTPKSEISAPSNSLEAVLELFHVKDTIYGTISWLNSFDSWENFVDKNFLKEENGHKNYVDKNYNINKLANHDFSNPSLDKTEYLPYFKNITEITQGRTLIIKEYYQKSHK